MVRGAADGESGLRRELYFFNLYRLLEAVLLLAAVIGPLADQLVSDGRVALARALAVGFPVAALVLLATGMQPRYRLARQAGIGLLLDLLVGVAAMHALGGLQVSIAMLLAVNVGAAAVLMPLRMALLFALLAAGALLAEATLGFALLDGPPRNLTEVASFGAGYLAFALLCNLLGQHTRDTQVLAERRGADLRSLSQLNELIIRRMRTGVLVVDADGFIQLFNEAAWHALGSPSGSQRELRVIAPELADRLAFWRAEHQVREQPLSIGGAEGQVVVPRFARLTASDDLFLIFLDDATLVSRRAEELTLGTLGRLSASIAHEIRNPLAAISYSAQLLEESEALPETDRRLVEIILSHCTRVNGIIENILNLSRRERSRPEEVDLAPWVRAFVDEYRNTHNMGDDELRAVAVKPRIPAMVDPRHLHQVVTNLVGNALSYGRMPGEAARVAMVARFGDNDGPPMLEIVDRGPGIPSKVAANIFEPFYTTHEYGTGLGLYIVRQLCEANQATVDHLPVAGGGSCFRITFAPASALHAL